MPYCIARLTDSGPVAVKKMAPRVEEETNCRLRERYESLWLANLHARAFYEALGGSTEFLVVDLRDLPDISEVEKAGAIAREQLPVPALPLAVDTVPLFRTAEKVTL